MTARKTVPIQDMTDSLPRTRQWLEDCRQQRTDPKPAEPNHATVPHNEFGQPDLQALVSQCGGYDKISPEIWQAWHEANQQWQQRRRARLARPRAER